MANLFGKNRLKEITQRITTQEILEYIAIVKTWHEDYYNGSLKLDKETSREQAYNQDFFIKILGYKEKPATPYTIEPKATTEKGQLPDTVLGYTDFAKNIINISAVVELKGASIPLDRPQRREGNMSPVQQGFKYKTQYRTCPFVIISNFYEFRLYHDNQLDFELWTLDDLVNPTEDYLLFKTWYALLKSDNFVTSSGISKTENLLSDIRIEQEEIGKKFYKVYKQARLGLLRDIYKRNIHIKSDIETGIEKAQKIIDRIVFACFAEDRGLLPDNTLQRVVKAAEGSAFGGSLWNTLKGFFEAIDVGSEKLEIPNGYNGGLFKLDEALNNLQIGDEALREVMALSNYNFHEDLSVNILGHIFEQSISDLEEIKNKVHESQNLETINQSRRKKDGIFYTPDYIVRYIVESSLGRYLHEQEEMLKVEFRLKGDITDKTYDKREKQAYGKYQDFLQNIKVVDPACGSGAFLVYVFDFLLAENKRVASILGNNLFSSDDYIKSILQNNIYGVDLNEESVEITKLSLWLKTAQKGKKLTALDQNIICGNSLIDDSKIAANKAFNWQQKFPEIFKSGGFDVVVGNPPYVVYISSVFGEATLDYVNNRYEYAEYNPNTYALFVSLALNELVKKSGYLGFIIPNTWLMGQYFSKMRKGIYKKQLNEIVYLKDTAFEEVVETLIILVKNELRSSDNITLSNDAISDANRNIEKFNQAKYTNGFNPFVGDESDLIQKLESFPKLNDYAIVYRGLETRDNKKYIASEKLSNEYLPILLGKDVNRYSTHYSGSYVKFIKSEMKSNANEAMYNQPKVLMRRTGVSIISDIDERNMFALKNLYLIIPKEGVNIFTIQAIIGSRLLEYYHFSKMGKDNKAFAQFQANYIESFPFVNETKNNFEPLVVKVRKYYSDICLLSTHFQEIILSEFNIEKWPGSLSKWWQFNFVDFVKALKVNLSLQQKDELLYFFEKYRLQCIELENKSKKIEDEIDQYIYNLYKITPEERSQIESAN